MAEFWIKGNGVSGGTGQLDLISSKMLSYQNEVGMIKNNLSFRIAGSSNIRSRLRMVEQKLNQERISVNNMSQGLNHSVQKYSTTERRICGRARVGNNLLDVIHAVFDGRGIIPENIVTDLKDIFDFMSQFNDSPGSYKDWKNLLLTGITKVKDFEDWIKGIPDDIIKVTTWSGSAAASWAYWKAGVEGKYGSAGVSALAADAYADASAGIFSKDEDGNLLFNPHIDAKAGVSFTALHADAETHIGDEMLGASASAYADIGKVDASANASVGILDENGELDPRLKVKASAEAIAVDAKAEAGITVLGTEAKVFGSVNVGIGAHADVGYEDGVLSFDIGASLGFGASIGFQVDVGGTIDAVKSGAKSALKKFLKW